MKGQKRRFTSFIKPPLPRWLYHKVLKEYPNFYEEFLHKADFFYSHGSIEKTIEEIERWLNTLPKN